MLSNLTNQHFNILLGANEEVGAMLLEHSDKKLSAPTRATGEATLRAFAPRMGKRYANGRNYDRGASNHRDVSMLSPYLRRRLLLEQDEIGRAHV